MGLGAQHGARASNNEEFEPPGPAELSGEQGNTAEDDQSSRPGQGEQDDADDDDDPTDREGCQALPRSPHCGGFSNRIRSRHVASEGPS